MLCLGHTGAAVLAVLLSGPTEAAIQHSESTGMGGPPSSTTEVEVSPSESMGAKVLPLKFYSIRHGLYG